MSLPHGCASHLREGVGNSLRTAPSGRSRDRGIGREPVSEDHATYDHTDPDEAMDGIKSVGDILRQIIDERGWPLPAVHPRPNGDSPHDAGASR